jgi:hypothetical protein
MNRRDFIKFGTTAMALPAIGVVSSDEAKQDDSGFWDKVLERVEEFQIKKQGVSLATHPAVKEIPKVTFSRELFHLYASRAWGYTPSELSNKNIFDRIDIYAWFIADWQIKEAEIYDAIHKNERRRNGR